MRAVGLLVFTFLAFSFLPMAAQAAEGSSIAGVVGGSDMRTAAELPPGLYAAAVGAKSESEDFFDEDGHRVPLLNDLEFESGVGAFVVLYVPDFKLAEGRIGLLGAVSKGRKCGQISLWIARDCVSGWSDPYVELNWTRFFGTVRSSQYENAFPIAEGLAVQFGIGAVIPSGYYDVIDASTKGLSIGNNVWDIAPMAAFTYTTAPILAEGTELSAKLYWNNYKQNPDTQYKTGDILSIDFAITERMGPIQLGLAGTYVEQIEDDQQFGQKIGKRVKGLSLGPVIAWDAPQLGVSMKLKVQKSVMERNAPNTYGAIFSIGTKLY